ncbi:FHA domain protein [Talaromyces stipitatus ATCC 10500]|uniref:FHA domain protein n=1 Tax=Talaromyces stipitatus (strain ATCC 10500 / CBS 375.48 / QM 6759 / NRRL 1006) TaxID=441959 RepID=B8LYG9_TALSN|nr:FHA domain protein [Talaromyces stipitatus ATCC 10500]EED22898.1 FHA domain protein [Talaromyces stipitatus ATCC 10500]
MSTTTTTVSESQTAPNRAGRLRRLSQLRAYTQSHFIPSSSSSSSSAATSPTSAGNQRRHRNSLSRVVSLSSPFHISTIADSSEPLAASASSSSEREAHQTDNSTSSDSDPQEQSVSSVSSRSLPSSHEVSSGLQAMAVESNGQQDNTTTTATVDASNANDSNHTSTANKKPKMNNTIRFFAYQDTHHSSRPSLQFSPMTRTLPSEDCVIRVGRYSERDGVPLANPSEPSDAPIGFKSKVVSRKHCEFSMVNGQWHIKDVGSSSGTFLNRTRLSQPNMASRLYAVRDGDIVQLGIDFRGGEEMIFRCVRIRIECNRTWQQRPNEFNKNTESLINNLGKGKAASNFEGCRECSICLGSVLRPYQCLFMAACAHVWHYKCIRRLIHTPDYPMFQCPNCRAWTDLSAEVDDSMEFDEESAQEDTSDIKPDASTDANAHSSGEQSQAAIESNGEIGTEDRDLATIAENLHLGEERNTPMQDGENPDGANITSKNEVHASGNSQSANIPIPNGSSSHGNQSNSRSDTPGHHETFEDDPMTPRNDSGPLALDGRAGHL